MSIFNELKEHPIRMKGIFCLLLVKAVRGHALIHCLEQKSTRAEPVEKITHGSSTQIFHLLKRLTQFKQAIKQKYA